MYVILFVVPLGDRAEYLTNKKSRPKSRDFLCLMQVYAESLFCSLFVAFVEFVYTAGSINKH